ncbi:hypothetical protein RB195_018228 [Necator americanus]|uniref:Uncharacterized protein n=1 Tax=Necator americanus TaxID=51031 RepID=A0ABR1CCE5_NECAM
MLASRLKEEFGESVADRGWKERLRPSCGSPGKVAKQTNGGFEHPIDRAAAIALACTSSFEVVTGVRQWTVAGPFLFNFTIDDTTQRKVDRRIADIILAPSRCP